MGLPFAPLAVPMLMYVRMRMRSHFSFCGSHGKKKKKMVAIFFFSFLNCLPVFRTSTHALTTSCTKAVLERHLLVSVRIKIEQVCGF